ncbi:MAG TPA: translation initiation factor IF-2, partial [Negativicutes bacterium]|nr:translation initiation factor IF-2 [Negativicutes bacterium]
VYELAKEFTTTSKLILDILDRNEMPAKNHMASIDEEAYQVLVRTFAPKPDTAEEIRERQRKKAATPAATAKPEQPKAPPAPPKVFYGGGGSPRPSMKPRHEQNAQIPLRQPESHPKPIIQSSPMNEVIPSELETASVPVSVTTTPIPSVSVEPSVAQPTVAKEELKDLPATVAPSVPTRPTVAPTQVGTPNYPFRAAAPFNPNNLIRQPAPQMPRPEPRPQQAPVAAGATGASGAAKPPRPGFTKPDAAPQNRSAGFRPPAAGSAAGASQTKPGPGQKNDRRVGSGDRPQGQGTRPGGNRPPFQGQGRPGSFSRRGGQSGPQAPKQEPIRPTHIKVGESLSVKELASKLGREVNEVIKKLMMLGVMATINQEVDFDTASLIAGEFGATVEELPPEIDPTVIPEIEDDPATLILRSPVVTVMGHVDHGKTSLLDAIRQTHVTSQEAGGITQHIGAYQVVQQGKKIVFLDTPGHEAFTSMRARGAQVTDIAVLVVAADDGVMPQTIEAINHAKSANVPIIVAINKMDMPDADPERVMQQMTEYGLVAEKWGGDTIMVPVSAVKKTGISELLEMILLVAEVQDLKANPNRPALGTIVEAELDKGKGPIATVLVQNGTLRIGDSIIAGTAYGKVRAMTNDRGEKVKKAGPSTPVEVVGLSDVPMAGDILAAVDERTARSIAEKRVAKHKSDAVTQAQKVTLEDLFQQIQAGEIKDLNLLVKADVQGSIEALRQSLESLKNKEVRVMIVHSGVGAINESDVMLASASNALIIGFNVRPDSNARKAAESEKVDIRTYRVIYDAINDVEAAMTGMLAPEFREVILGRVEIRQVFNIPKGVVAGSYVLEGKITSTSQVRLLRDGIVVFEGKLESLRRFKDDVKEVATGYECGITLEKFRDIKEGDIVEAFVMEQIPR